jgi:ribosomal protein L7/L12
MNLSRKLLIGAAMAGLLLGGCTSKVTEREQYSGFLPNYNNLQEVTTTSGEKAMRWVSPSWNPNAYDTVVFNRLELYPVPQPNERVNRQTLDELQNYMTSKAKGVLGQKYRVVPNKASVPVGSKALILRAAITGVSASNEGMKWYEVIPVAAVVGGVSAATGHRNQDTELFIEAELIDTSNNQTVAKVVRKVFGNQLKNASQTITTNDFKTAINTLTSDLQAFIR